MAEIQPFRAWRYAPEYSDRIGELTSPLFDVVSERQRQKLYHQQLNSIHLSVPLGEQPSKEAGSLLEKWKSEGILHRDPLPSVYVYYQYFSLPGTDGTFCRKGFICNIRAYDWDEDTILRHENTIPKAVNDRIDILSRTQLNVSPTHGLFTDETHHLEKYMDEAIQYPIYDVEDYQGVRDVLAIIHDRKIISEFIRVLSDKKVILADGHHRYEGSLYYRKERREANKDHTGSEGYNFHMMYLTNTESDDLKILPTHRLIRKTDLSIFEILRKLKENFDVTQIDEPHQAPEIIAGKESCFALLMGNSAWKLRLKEDRTARIPWKFPEEIKQLDLTILHYFIIEKVLGIPGRQQRTTEDIIFDRSFSDCLNRVVAKEAQLAIITNGISMDEVKKVCYSGYTLPQKSTYFYPKAICGYLFSSIKDEEFRENNFAGF